ncbi:histidine kinase [Nostoc sp.]
MGSGEWGDEGDEESVFPMPHAPCPMPNAQCLMPDFQVTIEVVSS